jgi:hypothetical protein
MAENSGVDRTMLQSWHWVQGGGLAAMASAGERIISWRMLALVRVVALVLRIRYGKHNCRAGIASSVMNCGSEFRDHILQTCAVALPYPFRSESFSRPYTRVQRHACRAAVSTAAPLECARVMAVPASVPHNRSSRAGWCGCFRTVIAICAPLHVR